MLISDFAIKRPVVTVATMLAIAGFGAFALNGLKTDEIPDVKFPVVGVMLAYPGASPEGVEREVLDPIEDRLAGISGVDKIEATVRDGSAQIAVYFDFDKDVQAASQQVRDAISEIRGDLPVEMEEPTIMHFDPADAPVMSITLTSTTLDAAKLTRIADPGLTRPLLGVKGVAHVTLSGGRERELTVALDPVAMHALSVSVQDIVAALQSQNLATPVGHVIGKRDERSIRFRGRILDRAAFEAIIVSRRGTQLVRLGEVASIRDGSEEARTTALFNTEPALGLDIIKAKGYSTTAVNEAIHAELARLRPTLPPGTRLEVVQDAGKRVAESVHSVQRALLEGAILTVLVVFVFLNSWRSTVITGLALPISVLASFVAVWAFGFTLNMMTLLGLSLAIGILIDDAIVVRENIVRHIEMGKDHETAARVGTSEIGLAVAATTFSIVAVFVPIAFMGGIAGQWFKPFALTMASSVLVSLFISFSLDPMLSAHWPDPHMPEHRKAWITRQLDRFNRWFDRLAERYHDVLAWALDHRAAMAGIAIGSLVLAIGLQVAVGGTDFMPMTDRSELMIDVEAPAGSNLEFTTQRATHAVQVARAHPEVMYAYTTVGGLAATVDKASIYVKLEPREQRSASQDEIGRRIREELKETSGVVYSVYSSGNGSYKQIQLQLRGTDARTLTRLAARVSEEVRKVPGAVDVGLSTRGEKPELQVDLDRGLAATLGLTAADVAQAIRPAFAGLDAGDWVDPDGETRDVMVRLTDDARRGASSIAQLPLMVSDAAGVVQPVPLGQVATITDGVGPAQIDHLDRDRLITVQANVSGRPLGDVVADIDARLATVTLPAGYRITHGGDAADQEEVFGRIFSALGIAVLLMYLVLVMQFGSFLDPFAILLSLPLSLIGVVGGLLVTGDSLNLLSLIGVILLMGIVAKNAILLVDFAKHRQAQGVPLRIALIEAGRVRLRPILMTTFALVAGMIPVAMGGGEGGDFYAPLGRAVIGGTITSTLLTLLVVPTFYEVLDESRERVRGWIANLRASRESVVVAGD
ncbi:MAG TPA: efflux RND transporter permease subunit [Gemmatimonadaceae bacterium]|nr:efflux RND transporter permease subunit [Gemmatimonadaceae bacterium]